MHREAEFASRFAIGVMASWANVLKAPAVTAIGVVAPPSDGPTNIAVIDANAIINGIRFEQMAGTIVTIPEVLEEIRDKQSRQFLATLPFGVEGREPSDESVKAGEIASAEHAAQTLPVGSSPLTHLHLPHAQCSALPARLATCTPSPRLT